MPIESERRRVLAAGADLTNSFAHHAPDKLWGGVRLQLAQAQLSLSARAPRVDVARVAQHKHMPRAARDLPHALRGDLLQLRRHADERRELLVEMVFVRRDHRELRLEVLHLHVQVGALRLQGLVAALQPRDVPLLLDVRRLRLLQLRLRRLGAEHLTLQLHLQLIHFLPQRRLVVALRPGARDVRLRRVGERHRVLGEAADPLDPLAGECGDGRGRGHVLRSLEPKLAGAPRAPRVDLVVLEDAGGVVAAARDVRRLGGEADDGGRRVGVPEVAVPQLAVLVVAPCEEESLSCERRGVLCAAGDGDDAVAVESSN
mmetsp:Transcript_31504/g.72080  ORF Transcript_31504/g.72080 Transcript_31504/m.72080 type:complete len:316 (-) Transcript_31504:131-1078(-)